MASLPTIAVKREVKRERSDDDEDDIVDTPEEELIATNPGGNGGDEQDRAPQTQDEYFLQLGLGFTRVEEAIRGEWLTQQYARKRKEAGCSDDAELLAPTEEEIILQERLPDNLENFKDPLTNWISCPGEAPIPSWNKDFLPEEPLNRPPTPVKINNSIYKWIVKEKENSKPDKPDDEDETVVIVKEGTMIRVRKRTFENKQRENSFRGRPSRGVGRGFSRSNTRPSHGQGRYRPRSRDRSRSPRRHRSPPSSSSSRHHSTGGSSSNRRRRSPSTSSRRRSPTSSRHRSPPNSRHSSRQRSPPNSRHSSRQRSPPSSRQSSRHSSSTGGGGGGGGEKHRSPESSPEEYRQGRGGRSPSPHHRPRERLQFEESSRRDYSKRGSPQTRDSFRESKDERYSRSSREDREGERRREDSRSGRSRYDDSHKYSSR